QKRGHISNLERQWRDFYYQAVADLAYDLITGSSMKQQLVATKQELQSELDKVKKIREQAEDEARRKGVIKEAIHFKKLADWATGISIGWLAIALGMASGTLYYAWHSSTLSIQNLGTSPNLVIAIATMLPRLITITILLTGLVFCLRNFAAMS